MRSRWWVSSVALAAAALSGLVFAAPAQAQIAFPFTTDFSTSDGGTLTGTAEISDGWLRLTDAVGNQSGSWVTDDSFPTDLGLEVTFDYATYGGTGADGFSFFLADAAAPQGVGTYGGGLGYSCASTRAGASGTCDLQGMPGGYVGVGFDEYGNYSLPLSNSGPGKSPNTIAVRGSGDGVSGYQYLAGAAAPGNTVSTGSRAGERTAQVSVVPNANGALTLSVMSNSGPGTPLQPVISDLDLGAAGQAPLPAQLRLGFAAGTGGQTNIHEIDSLAVNVPTDLAITKTGPAQVTAGDAISYTVQARNEGTNDAAGSIVRDAVPSTVTNVTWTCAAAQGAACIDPTGSGNTIEARADLPVGGVATYTVHGQVDPGLTGALVNTATVSPPADRSDINPDNDSATATTTVGSLADLQIIKLPPTAPPQAGGDTQWRLIASNSGPSVAQDVTITDTLPDALTFVSSTPAGCSVSGNALTCPVGTLAPGDSTTIELDLRVASSTPAGTTILNTASVSSSTADPDLTNNTSEARSAAVVVIDPSPGDPDHTIAPPALAFTGGGVSPAAGVPAIGVILVGLVLSLLGGRRRTW